MHPLVFLCKGYIIGIYQVFPLQFEIHQVHIYRGYMGSKFGAL